MTDRVTELHNKYIINHEHEHQQNPALPFTTLQTLNPDLSCQLCYPPPRTSSRTFLRTPFGRFWNWYSNTYNAYSYTSHTTTSLAHLTITRDRPSIRTTIRDIIFSCRYNRYIEIGRAHV